MENIQFKNQTEVAFPAEVSQRRAGEGDAAAQVHSAYHTKFPSWNLMPVSNKEREAGREHNQQGANIFSVYHHNILKRKKQPAKDTV